jgi:Fic family protein
MITAVYASPTAMEPMLPEQDQALEELAVNIVRAAGQLSGRLHPITRLAVAALVRSMNSYYSNLIEGHNTHPLDIERALRKDLSMDPAKRALQLESKAHVEVQTLIEERLRADASARICSADFLRWIHKEFYERLPDEFQIVKTKTGLNERVHPGELRRGEVEVGQHVAPSSTALLEFLSRFESVYEPSNLTALQRIIATAASHHRLAWIHPFLDGNGRVSRLFTDAYFQRIHLTSHGLWTVSRGLARHRDKYFAALGAADAKRWNDYDGRGNLSLKALVDFCRFFLEVCLDQIRYMSALLEFETIDKRICSFAERFSALHGLPREMAVLLRDCFLRGEVSRGEAAKLLDKPERTARRLLQRLLEEDLIASEGPGKPLRIKFPMQVVGYYFPKLFPEGVENDLGL